MTECHFEKYLKYCRSSTFQVIFLLDEICRTVTAANESSAGLPVVFCLPCSQRRFLCRCNFWHVVVFNLNTVQDKTPVGLPKSTSNQSANYTI